MKFLINGPLDPPLYTPIFMPPLDYKLEFSWLILWLIIRWSPNYTFWTLTDDSVLWFEYLVNWSHAVSPGRILGQSFLLSPDKNLRTFTYCYIRVCVMLRGMVCNALGTCVTLCVCYLPGEADNAVLTVPFDTLHGTIELTKNVFSLSFSICHNKG